VLGPACDPETPDGATASAGGIGGVGGGDAGTAGDDGGDGSADDDDGGGDAGSKFDLPPHDPDGPGAPAECSLPEHMPCDDGTGDPFVALGLGCPGELEVHGSTQGPDTARGVRTSLGSTHAFDPTEGQAYAVIGSGLVAELDTETPDDDIAAFPTHCNDDLGDFDPGASLPAPLRTNDVEGDCSADAGLIGSGDCSNTIAEQFTQGDSANDYVELRFEVDVPKDVISFSYDFAFLSTEYPAYFGSTFNDMYVGWLESEAWTGNISFDAEGNPISLNAGFLDFKDDDGTLPELAGTCMRQHAATDWLTSTSGVTPGEHITLVFAVFDLSDSALDSYVLLDNFEWGCDPTLVPQTEPVG
jgi:hypothetical protein